MCATHLWENNLHLYLRPWRLECYSSGRNTYFHPLYKHSIYGFFGYPDLIHKLDESLAKMHWREFETRPPRCSAYYSCHSHFHFLLHYFGQRRHLISKTQGENAQTKDQNGNITNGIISSSLICKNVILLTSCVRTRYGSTSCFRLRKAGFWSKTSCRTDL